MSQELTMELLALTMKQLACEAIKGTADVMNTVGTELSKALFDKQYGSVFCSVTNAGKAKTEQRIRDCNEMAGNMVTLATMLLKEMTTEQIRALVIS